MQHINNSYSGSGSALDLLQQHAVEPHQTFAFACTTPISRCNSRLTSRLYLRTTWVNQTPPVQRALSNSDSAIPNASWALYQKEVTDKSKNPHLKHLQHARPPAIYKWMPRMHNLGNSNSHTFNILIQQDQPQHTYGSDLLGVSGTQKPICNR